MLTASRAASNLSVTAGGSLMRLGLKVYFCSGAAAVAAVLDLAACAARGDASGAARAASASVRAPTDLAKALPNPLSSPRPPRSPVKGSDATRSLPGSTYALSSRMEYSSASFLTARDAVKHPFAEQVRASRLVRVCLLSRITTRDRARTPRALGAALAPRREAGDEMPMDIVPERCGYREGRCQFRNPPAARVLLSVGAGHVADYK